MVRAALIIIGSTLLIFLGVVAGLMILASEPLSMLLIYAACALGPFIVAIPTAMIMSVIGPKIYRKTRIKYGLPPGTMNKEAREEADRKEKRVTILVGVSILILFIIVLLILAL